MNNFLKYIATYLPLACLVLLSHSAVAQGFEGEIILSAKNPAMQEESNVRWLTANGNHKLVLNGTANGKAFSYVILMLKGESNLRLLTEIDGQKAMFVTPAGDAKPVTTSLGAATVTEGEGTTNIAGHSAKKYSIESAEGSVTVFVTNQVSLSLSDMPALLQKDGVFATLAANNIKGLPLSIISRGSDGKVLFSQTVTSIKPGSIAAAEFSYEGYGDGAAIMQNSIKAE